MQLLLLHLPLQPMTEVSAVVGRDPPTDRLRRDWFSHTTPGTMLVLGAHFWGAILFLEEQEGLFQEEQEDHLLLEEQESNCCQ